MTALMQASRTGQANKVALLLAAGAPVNQESPQGRTSLMLAVRARAPRLDSHGRPVPDMLPVVTLLLDVDANPLHPDHKGITALALHQVARQASPEMGALLEKAILRREVEVHRTAGKEAALPPARPRERLKRRLPSGDSRLKVSAPTK